MEYNDNFNSLLNAISYMGNTEGDINKVLLRLTEFYTLHAMLCLFREDKLIDVMITMLHVTSLRDPEVIRETARDFYNDRNV